MDKTGIKIDFWLNNKYVKSDVAKTMKIITNNLSTATKSLKIKTIALNLVGVIGVTLVLPEPDGPTSIKPCLTTVVS